MTRPNPPSERRSGDANQGGNPRLSSARRLDCRQDCRAVSRPGSSVLPRRLPEELAWKCNQSWPIKCCRSVLLGEISIERERDSTRITVVDVWKVRWKTIPKFIICGHMIAFHRASSPLKAENQNHGGRRVPRRKSPGLIIAKNRRK